ncbi:uncharacterized protein LOC130544274 [Ursus arctos]|nr:uncharacterized protein LOC130544274 [Ursus arctos]
MIHRLRMMKGQMLPEGCMRHEAMLGRPEMWSPPRRGHWSDAEAGGAPMRNNGTEPNRDPGMYKVGPDVRGFPRPTCMPCPMDQIYQASLAMGHLSLLHLGRHAGLPCPSFLHHVGLGPIQKPVVLKGTKVAPCPRRTQRRTRPSDLLLCSVLSRTTTGDHLSCLPLSPAIIRPSPCAQGMTIPFMEEAQADLRRVTASPGQNVDRQTLTPWPSHDPNASGGWLLQQPGKKEGFA